MNDKTGGPAFPCTPDNAARFNAPGSVGMTLRDYFAAKALHTISAYPPEDIATWSADDFAKHAYATADAMLKARQS